MSSLGLLNYYLLQWFFVRLAKSIDSKTNKVSWSILRWIYPGTGWNTPYKRLKRIQK